MASTTPRSLRIAALLPLLALAASGEPLWPVEPVSGEELLAAQPSALVDRLREEKVVMLQEFSEREAYGGRIHALVLFERPSNQVVRFLVQGPRQTEFRPELRRARLVEEFEGGQLVDYQMRMMLMRVEYRARHGWDFERGLVWWSLDPEFDNDFAVLEGQWEVFALGPEQTLARFGTKIDVGPALPAFVQDYATRKRLPESMHNVRKWVDSGGTFRP